ncbi:MAG: NYN domain-containing protein [Candidatus Latescibacterota bacterium]
MASLPKQVAESLNPERMNRIIHDSLDHIEIVKLCNICGLNYPGIRTKSVPTSKLILDLVDQFYSDEPNARAIIKTLTRVNKSWIKTVGELAPEAVDDLLKKTSGRPDEGHIGGLLFALACDGRVEVRELMDQLDAEFPMGESACEYGVPEAELHLQPGNPEASKLEKVAEDYARVQKRLDELTHERKVFQSRINELQHELSASHKANSALEEESALLKRKLEETSAHQTQEDLSAEMRHLARETRKIQHELTHSLRPGTTGQGPSPFLEAIGESIEQLKGLLNKMALRRGEEQTVLRQMFEDIGREVHTLRVETKRLQEPEARVVKSYGEDARVGVFVDVQNVFYAARQFGARVDFEKLLEATVGKRRLIKAIAYVVQSPDVDQTSFLSMLQQKSYEVKRKELRLRSDGSAKGDWDMGMAIDMIGLADKLDVVVIVSGDGDFVSLAHLLKTMGPKVEVFSFIHNTARDLVQAADSYYSIDEGLLLKMNNHGTYRAEVEAEA